MWKDLRHAARTLLQAKGWTAVVLASLALGIGANLAMFSAVNGLLLRKLPVRDPDTLVRLRSTGQNDMATSSSDYGYSAKTVDGANVRATVSAPMFRQFVASNQTMEELLACAPFGRVNLIVDGRADVASAFISTGNYYQMLGARARLGRLIVPDDDRADAAAVAVISAKYWQSRFGGDPNVVGKVVRANNVPITIVGVLAADFAGIQSTVAEAPEIAFPLALDPQLSTDAQRLNQDTYWWLQVMGRLKPGVTAAQVQGNLDAVFQNTARAGIDSYLSSLKDEERNTAANRRRREVPRLYVDSGSRGLYDAGESDKRSVTILFGVVALVLVIVCANVANLLLARAASRQKELSVRLSLGATRLRLVRQLMTESLLLATIGGALGLVVAYWGRQLLPGNVAAAPAVDWRIAAFMIALTGLTGLAFGIAPALRATSGDINDALKAHSRGVVATRSVLGRSLLVAQVAISLVLLVGAGLFLRTLENLRRVDVGFNPTSLALFRVNTLLNRYDEARANAVFREMLDRLAAVPGVRSVSFSQPALLSGSVNSTSIFVQGRSYALGERGPSINRLVVSPNFFDAMGIRLQTGRKTTARDDERAPKVVVINDAAARKYFPGEDPLGRRFGSSPETSGTLEIVGVVADAKYNSVRDEAPPTMYVPFAQTRMTSPMLAVRTAGDPLVTMKDIRTAVAAIDPDLPITDVSTQSEQIERRFTQERLFAQAYAIFGGLALLIAAIGLFGLMSYSVSRRTNEIGIRMALGAQRAHVLRQVLTESVVLAVIGIAVGLAAALAAGRLVATMLFNLAPSDAITITIATVVMLAVAALAGYFPARRASRVDPMVALRYN